MNKKATTFVACLSILVIACMIWIPSAHADVSGGMNSSGNTGGGMNSSGNTGGAMNPSSPSTFTLQNPLKVTSIGGLVQNFVEIFSYIAVLLGVLVLIYVGFSYILASAQGNSSRIKELHSWLLWAVVGIAIVIAARVLVDVVINTISATGTVSPGVMQSVKSAASGN